MPWTDGTAIVATSVTLIDSTGATVGTLDGSNGLVLYGNGDANNPGLTLTPFGDLFWGNFDVNAATGPRIEAGNTGLQIIAGTDVGDPQPAALVVDTHLLTADTNGVQLYPFLYGNNESGSGSPTPAVEIWHDAVLLNGWTNFGTPYDNVGYKAMPDGTVRLRGVGKSGTITGGTIMFNLPVGYRPAKQKFPPVSADGGATNPRITVGTNGNVAIFGLTAASDVGFDSSSFELV